MQIPHIVKDVLSARCPGSDTSFPISITYTRWHREMVGPPMVQVKHVGRRALKLRRVNILL